MAKIMIDVHKEANNNDSNSDESNDNEKSHDNDPDYNIIDDIENSDDNEVETNDQVLLSKDSAANSGIEIGVLVPDENTDADKVTNKQSNCNDKKENVKRTTRQRKIYSCIESDDKIEIDERGNINVLKNNLNIPGTPIIDCKSRYVSRIKKMPTTSKSPKRLPKKHNCYYCNQLISDQIRRHINTVHKNEKTMIEAARLGQTELRNFVTNIINLGDYNYNNSNASENKEMLVARRPNRRKIIKPKVNSDTGELIWPKEILNTEKPCVIVNDSSEDGRAKIPKIFNYDLPESEIGDQYVPCLYCFKTVKRSTLSKHKCIHTEKLPSKKGLVNECDNLIPNIHPIANQRLRDLVLKTMRSGYIKDIVKRDESIILFGNAAVTYYNNDQDYQMISHQLRLLASIVYYAKSKNGKIANFEDLLHRDHIELVEHSLREMTEYNEATATLEKPHKTKEITVLLKKVVDFFISKNNKLRQDEKSKEIQKFWDALKIDIKILNKKSRESNLKNEKLRKPKVIPKVNDINKLVVYAENIRIKAFEILSTQWDPYAFDNLNKSTLLLLQIFNRKRQGEISRLLVDDLKETCIYKLHDDCNGDEYTSLSKESQEAAKDYYRVSIVNKKGLMNVGLIIHKDILNSLKLIIENRSNAKLIKPNNKYVFAEPSYNNNVDQHYKAYLIMKEYSVKCGASKPETLRGTLLRKQVATMMYGINTDDNKLRDLARFLGHDYEIHKNYYRDQIPVRELINITPMLQEAQGIDSVKSNICSSTKSFSTTNNQEDTLNLDESNTSEYRPSETSTKEDSTIAIKDDSVTNSECTNFFEDREKQKKEKKTMQKQIKGRKRCHENEFNKNVQQTKKLCQRIVWTEEEKAAVANYISEHGMPNKVSSQYLDDLIKSYPILQIHDRTPAKIRAYLHNNNLLSK